LYQQFIKQKDFNRELVEVSYKMGELGGPALTCTEAKWELIEAKINLSTFLLNETDLTLDEYAHERQNLRSLYEEAREVAKEAIKVSREAYEVRRADFDKVSKYERKLLEVEIALIRLFPEKEAKQMPVNKQSIPK
jgi:hypothetical protein